MKIELRGKKQFKMVFHKIRPGAWMWSVQDRFGAAMANGRAPNMEAAKESASTIGRKLYQEMERNPKRVQRSDFRYKRLFSKNREHHDAHEQF